MTLPLNSRLSALYDTNGTQKDFSFGFRVFFDPDNGGYGLEVRRQTADGYEVIPKSDYLVLPVEDNSAGVVRFSVAPSAGQQIYIAGKTPTIQQLVLTNFGRYSAESIETQFDFITAIIQEWLSALGEETRQRIAADEILTQYVVQRIDAFVQQINQNWDDKSQEIEDYISTIMPSFTQTLREEIEAYAVAGMQDAIDQTLAESKAEIDDAVSRANAAALAAAITGKVYDTPEAGVDPVTGVANGAYFNVRSSSDESYIDEYQNIGGVPTPSGKSYPSSAAVNALKYTTGITDPFSGLTQDKINSYSLTPFHFGAIGDGTSHKLSERYTTLSAAQAVYPHAVSLNDEIDWCAVQALFNYVRYEASTYLKYNVNISGIFMLTRSLQYRPNNRSQGGLRTFDGDFVGLCDNLDTTTRGVLEINTGAVQFTGIILIDTQKKADYGIWVSDGGQLPSGEFAINFGIKLGRCFISKARIFNITFNDAAMFATLDFYRGDGGGQSYDTTVSNIVYDAGNGVSNGSTLNIGILPDITDVNLPILIDYNGRVSTVNTIDTATKTITVSPALKTGGAAPDLKATIFYGGGIKTSGADSAGILINQMSTVVDNIGLCHTAMYPCHVNYFCSEFTKTAIFSSGLVGGAHIDTAYFEGDKWQYIQKTNGYDFSGTTCIEYATGIEIDKHDVIQWARDPVTGRTTFDAGIQGYQLYEKGLHHLQRKLPSNAIPNGYSLDFNTPYETKSEYTNNLDVYFAAINEYYNQKFGYDTQSLVVTGSGNNGAPTTVTFKPPVGYTLNGGSSDVVFSNFNAAAHFTAKLAVVSKDIIVSCNSLESLNLSVIGAIPPQYADAAQLPVNTFYDFMVGSRTGLPSPSTSASVGNIKTYYSSGASGYANFKTQRVEFPAIREVWERVYSSSTGSYFAWTLVSYVVKAGTTAQRPSNPQLGMRYYDTTLLATGKPIEWNGSNWIDMTGAAV